MFMKEKYKQKNVKRKGTSKKKLKEEGDKQKEAKRKKE